MTELSNVQPETPGADAPFLPSLAGNSLARFGANLSTLVGAFGTSLITARWLGPSGKGTLAVLSLIGALLFRIFGLGLGEAAIVLKRKGKATLQELLSTSILPTTGAALAALSVFPIAIMLADWYSIQAAVMLQGGVLFLALHSNLFLSFVNAKERFLVSSILISARDVSLILATVACVVVFDGGLVGAVLAAALAELVLLIGSFGAIGRVDLRLRLAWNPSFLAGALPIGLGFSLTYVFIVMAQRLDQLIVYQLEGPAPAGLYSVALTVSQLTAYAAGAISLTSFPRIADLDDDAVAALIERVARLAAASAVLAGALVALAAPLGMRVAFGDAYGPAAAPTLLLVVGAIVYSQQIALARGAAARGRVRVLVVSFAINVLLMTGLAYVLIPTFGLQGAALASIGGSVAGYLVCLRAFGRSSPLNLPFRKLVPTPADFGEVLSKLGSLVQSRKPGRN